MDLFIISSLNSFYIYLSHSYDFLPVQTCCISLYFCLLNSEKIATYVNVFVACLKMFSLGKLWVTKQSIIITVCIVKISSWGYSFSVISVTCWNFSHVILVLWAYMDGGNTMSVIWCLICNWYRKILSCSCLCPIHWSQVLSREWRCSWSSADRRCFNYIWVIHNLIAY